uniref:Trichohyalin-plectin-homology domain-containing protein n=1 Tax=Ceratitis capitata TaxID=7213 RepID=W8AZF6_CERCA
MLSEKDKANNYFFNRTDRRSLHTQLKDLVQTALDVAAKELNQRRKKLRRMLEREDKIYEEEFASKVKSRIDEDIKTRKAALFKIKEQRSQYDKEFLDKKNIQLHFENCHEIREALRLKETQQTKEIHLEQIVEKKRAFMRERQLDEYWCKVRDANAQHYDKCQAEENQMKCNLKRKMRCLLEEQIEMHKKQEECQREQKRVEAKVLAKVAEQMRLEEFDRVDLGKPAKTQEYREELLAMIAKNKATRDAEKCARIEEHSQLMRKVAQEQRDESASIKQHKRAVYNATIEYIDYAQRMRKLEQDAENMRQARTDDLRHVDICTKSNIQRELQQKAEVAALCYAELRHQMNEEHERRLRDIAEQREEKIIENRFARPEKTRAEITAERFKTRKQLDEQLAENARIHAEQEAKYNAELKLAPNDPEFCKQLAEKYLSAGIDYLPPHANWLIYACPQQNFSAKQNEASAAGDHKRDFED